MYLFQTHTVYIKKEYAVDAANAKSLGGSGDRAALVEGTILHATLVDSSDDVEVSLVAPRGGPGVGDSPVLQKE